MNEYIEPASGPTNSGNWTGEDNYDISWYIDHESDASFTIFDEKDLAGLAYLVNKGNDGEGSDFNGKTIVLSNDLNLINYYWTPIGSTSVHSFKGTFDGQGKTISGLMVSIEGEVLETSTNGFLAVGLFGWNEGSIKNVILSNSSISAVAIAESEGACAYAGGIAGANVESGKILNCNNAAKVIASSPSHSYAAGIAGLNEATISLCTNSGEVCIKHSTQYLSHTANVNGEIKYYGPDGWTGGIVGLNVNGEISQCVNHGKIYSSSLDPNTSVSLNSLNGISLSYYVGGIVSYNMGGTISECINKGEIIASIDLNNTQYGSYACTGGIAGLNSYKISNCYNSGVISSKSDVIADVYSNYYLYAGGIAGSTTKYETDSITKESSILSCCNEGNVSAENILDLNYAKQYHSSYSCAGGIVGYAEYVIENCCNLKDAKITASSSMSDYMEDESRSYAGGIAAYNESNSLNISNCYNEGTISSASSSSSARSSSPGSTAYSGGIIGYLSTNGLIEDCYSTVGGITAESESHMNRIDKDRYPSVSYAGGISGRTLGIIINCFNESNVSSFNLVDTNINNTNILRLYPSANAGGITGSLDDGDENEAPKKEIISYCYNKGDVNASGDINSESRSGGITGFISEGGAISYSYNKGEISSSFLINTSNASANTSKQASYIGGIVGISTSSSDKISSCYNLGKVHIGDGESTNNSIPRLGGICGMNEGSIIDCYNTAELSSGSIFNFAYLGGIAGSNRGSMKNCYTVGSLTVSNSGLFGSVIGENYSSGVSNTFYLNDSKHDAFGFSSPKLEKSVACGLEQSAMIDLSLLTGDRNLNSSQNPTSWSPDIFDINDGYPILANTPVDLRLIDKHIKSPAYITINEESLQVDNFLKPCLINDPVSYTIHANFTTTNDLVNGEPSSYEWHSINNGVASPPMVQTSGSFSSDACGTYFVKIGFKGVEDKASDTYYYTSLTRTIHEGEITVTFSIGNETTTQFIPCGDRLTNLENPEKSGYEFTGWYSDAEFKTEFDLNTPIISNTTLYAKFVKTVVFEVTPSDATIIVNDLDGNIISPESSATNSYKLTYGKEYTYTISKNGYKPQTVKFEVDDDTSTDNFKIQLSSSSSGGTPVSYNVTYNANGGSGTLIDANSPYHSGVTVLVLENNFTKDGCTFKNWNTKADGSGTSYSAGDRFSINSNVTLYAQWEEVSTPPAVQKVTVTFYIGNEVYKVVEVNKDSSLKDKFPVNPESSDNDSNFKEWNTKEDASGTAFTADSTISEDTSVYAVWEKSLSSSSHSWWWIIIIIIILIIIAAAYYYYKKNQN
ncbi:InlB B-repeat-containing protein [Candidatus Methanomassiliicoccus intestinalis]|uniref:InlB B-repeat-containing protein n=1 Tax=Candidatus Methanomassiliicoccus intestinalis TaxID=1406512 RepID=UPI0037DC9038